MSDRNARFLQAGDLDGDQGRRRLPVETGELYTASDQTSGTLVGELRVFLEDCRAAVVGMMNQEARAECQIKPNDFTARSISICEIKSSYAAVAKIMLISTRNKFCTFGIGICKLVHLG